MRDGRVPVVGHGDQRRVHLFEVEHVTIVAKGTRGGTDLLRLIELVVPNVAESDDVTRRVSTKLPMSLRPRSPQPMSANCTRSLAPITRE